MGDYCRLPFFLIGPNKYALERCCLLVIFAHKTCAECENVCRLPNTFHGRRILESLSTEEEDQPEKNPSQTPPEIEPYDKWQKSAPEIEEASSSDAENDSVVIITDSSDEEPTSKAEVCV